MGWKASGGSSVATWQDYTPTWTNFTIGNGTDNSRFIQFGTGAGTLVIVKIEVLLGSTSSFSGALLGTLPVTAPTLGMGAAELVLGNAQFTDAGTAFHGAIPSLQSTTQFQIRYADADNAQADRVTYAATSSTLPFTWATGDSFSAMFQYEAAA